MAKTNLTPLTVTEARDTHGMSARSDEQVQWYCDLDALILRAYALDIPGSAVMAAIEQIALDRLIESSLLSIFDRR